MRDAAAYIDRATGGRASPVFAYPFGHHNDFLARDYLPSLGASCVAAVTTEPRLVAPGDSPFLLPRFVCGAHWRTPGGTRRLPRRALTPATSALPSRPRR